MAQVIRYVNTAGSVGTQDGTTSTSGSSGTAAFATLRQAIDAIGASISGYAGSGNYLTIYCQGSAADTGDLNQTPWDFSTTATEYLEIVGEQSPLHPNFSTAKSGKYDTSLYHITATNRNVCYNNIPSHIRFHGLQGHATVTNGSDYIVFKTSNQNQTATDIACVMSHCIARATMTSGTVTGYSTRYPDAAANGTSRVYNCLAYDCNVGFNNDFGQDTDVGEYYNCTAADCTYGFIEDATMKVVNCLCKGATIGFVGSFASGSNYNAEDDGNGAPGANSRSAVTFTFVNAASDDFHLSSSDAGAKDFGTSSVGGLFTDDCDGQTRSGSWDIGFDEYQAAGSSVALSGSAATVGRGTPAPTIEVPL